MDEVTGIIALPKRRILREKAVMKLENLLRQKVRCMPLAEREARQQSVPRPPKNRPQAPGAWQGKRCQQPRSGAGGSQGDNCRRKIRGSPQATGATLQGPALPRAHGAGLAAWSRAPDAPGQSPADTGELGVAEFQQVGSALGLHLEQIPAARRASVSLLAQEQERCPAALAKQSESVVGKNVTGAMLSLT